MAERIAFEVNEETRTVEVAPDTPLLYVLRNELGLSNPHFGCGLAFRTFAARLSNRWNQPRADLHDRGQTWSWRLRSGHSHYTAPESPSQSRRLMTVESP